MSDKYLHHEGPERPSQDWSGGQRRNIDPQLKSIQDSTGVGGGTVSDLDVIMRCSAEIGVHYREITDAQFDAWRVARDPRYARFDKALESLQRLGENDTLHAEIEADKRQRRFEIIRDTLEEAGIPFIRANTLAERCHRALGEIP